MKLEMISKYPLKSSHPRRSFLYTERYIQLRAGMGIFSITSLNMASRLTLSTCVDTAKVKDGKNCVGPELPISLKTLQMLFGNCLAHRL